MSEWVWDVMPHELRADDERGTVILRCRDNEPTETNAHLIAAAPLLLEALRIVCEYFDAQYDRPSEYYFARDAIAKAEGLK